MNFIKKNKLLVLFIPIFIYSVLLLVYVFQPTPTSLRNNILPLDRSEVIVVYGDTRTGHDIHQLIVDNISKLEPIAIFHTGDLVNDGTIESEWDTFNEITSELLETTDFYPSLGNHEKNSDLYFENFDLPNNERWYSVDYNDIHFIILDSNISLSSESEQYTWLEADLLDTNRDDFVVSIFHHPPFSTGPHKEDEMNLRESIVPLFEEYDVEIVFNGHDHNYERSFSNDIYYIVAGGGGAPLRDQERISDYSQKFLKSYNYCVLEMSENELNVSVYNEVNTLIDEFVVEK
ncbi:metallophosphoesterase family protein [Patescibacteria group bacterium]